MTVWSPLTLKQEFLHHQVLFKTVHQYFNLHYIEKWRTALHCEPHWTLSQRLFISVLNASLCNFNKWVSGNVGKRMTLSDNNCNKASLWVSRLVCCLTTDGLNSCLIHCLTAVHTTTNCDNSRTRGMSHTLTHSGLKCAHREEAQDGKMSHLSNRTVKLSLGVFLFVFFKGKLCPLWSRIIEALSMKTRPCGRSVSWCSLL